MKCKQCRKKTKPIICFPERHLRHEEYNWVYYQCKNEECKLGKKIHLQGEPYFTYHQIVI